jgi:hypothetical protein
VEPHQTNQPEFDQKTMEELSVVIVSAVERRCKPLLNRKQRKAYEKLAQADPEGAFDFLEQCIPNISQITQEETERVQREAADTHDAVMKRLGMS